jgi:hypothetical protein
MYYKKWELHTSGFVKISNKVYNDYRRVELNPFIDNSLKLSFILSCVFAIYFA